MSNANLTTTYDEVRVKAAMVKVANDVESTVKQFKDACSTVADDFNSTGSSAGGDIGAAVAVAYENYVATPFETLQKSLAGFRTRVETIIACTEAAVGDVTANLTSTTRQS